MTDEPLNRRNGDKLLQEVKDIVLVLQTRQDLYISHIDKCMDKTDATVISVGRLQTKMSIVTWVGSAFAATGLAVIGRTIYTYISKHPPPTS